MVRDERFDISFEKVIETAGRYENTGYNRSYLQVYERSLRDKIIDVPDSDSVYRLIKFVNSWRNRTRYSILPELLAVLSQNTERNATLRQVRLESPSLDDVSLQTVQTIFEELCRVGYFGPTGASKFLGIIHPQLCVMWDEPIRDAYGYRTNSKGKVPKYSDFLLQMRELALKVLEDAAKQHEIFDPASYISEKYNLNPPFNLATFVNHYVWVTFTLPLQKKSI